ncbi:MAG: hypothetical protein H0V83_07735 [Rubrobacter sp.]|nr:hypothetical protein [Rubrobacter sp.]
MAEDHTMFRGELAGSLASYGGREVGISGYVLKSSSAAQLVGAVRAAALNPNEGNVVVGMP